MLRRTRLVAVALWTLFPLLTAAEPAPPAEPAEPQRAEVLVLGVYHMANPGNDLFNSEADDVLAPKRQGEIAELIEVLGRFRPTKIAVEANFGDKRIASRFSDYLAGEHELSRNEIEQLGFRLARQLGHDAVYPVDADGEFPYPRLADYAKAHDREQEFQALMGELRAWVEEGDGYLASHTILERLLMMNSDESVAEDLGFYYREAHFGEAWNWAGADLLAAWFQRNIRIYSNVVQIIDSPGERILVIFGAGHLGWLRQSFDHDPTIRLRKLAEFVR